MIWLRRAAIAAVALALLALALSGPLTRFDVWSYRIGLELFRWGGYLGAAAAVLAVAVLAWPAARRIGIAAPLVVLVVGLIAYFIPSQFWAQARAVPRINDITTDTANPPQYMTASRPYPREFATLQKQAYPDLATLELRIPTGEAYARAVAAAEAMGWEVVGRDAAAGTIEAVDTTRWFGFRDDIAIRVSDAPDTSHNRSRIDVRSKSRVGRNDFGTNARRIRTYLQHLQ